MNKVVNFFKKYSNKGIAVLCVIAIVFVSFFSLASTASADDLADALGDDLYDWMKDYIFTNGNSNLSNYKAAVLEYGFVLLRVDKFCATSGSYYFPDKTTVEGPVIAQNLTGTDGSGNTITFKAFSDDYLRFYFDAFAKGYSCVTFANICEKYGIIRQSLNTKEILAATSSNYPLGGYDFDGFKNYFNARYCKYLIDEGSDYSDSGYENKNPDDYSFEPRITGEELKKMASEMNSRYMPIAVQDFYVWSYNSSTTTKRNPKKAADWINSFTFFPTVPVYSNTSTVWGGKGWGGSKEKGVYILPFWVDDDSSYGTCFNKYYIHLYAIAATSDTTAKLCMDLYNLSDNSLAKSYSVDWSSDYSYLGFTFYSAFTIFGYKSNADYYAHKSASQRLRSDANMTLNYYSSDYKAVYWNSMIVASTFNPDTDKSDDWGYYVQNSPFELFANQTSIDFNRIPNNFIITIKGDTIYDYSITNPDTGDTTDIDDYIKHDYDIPDVEDPDNPDDNGGGGSISGNVTVGGKVDVSGKIEIDTKPIDININVNSGSSSGSSATLEAGDLIDPGTVDTNLDHYLDKVPELSKGFIDYLKDFFAWLPDEIYGLIILGLVVCIFCRIAGR